MHSAVSRCQRSLIEHLSRQAVSHAFAAGQDFVQASKLAASFEALKPLRASPFWSLTPSIAPVQAVPDLQLSGVSKCSHSSLAQSQPSATSRSLPSAASIHNSTSAAQAAQPQLAHLDDDVIYPHEQPVRFPFHARAFFIGVHCSQPCMCNVLLSRSTMHLSLDLSLHPANLSRLENRYTKMTFETFCQYCMSSSQELGML